MKTKILSCAMAIVLCTCLSVTAFATVSNDGNLTYDAISHSSETSDSTESVVSESDAPDEPDKPFFVADKEELSEDISQNTAVTTGPNLENGIIITNKETGEKIEINSKDLSDFCGYICVMSAIYVGLIILLVIIIVAFASSVIKKNKKEQTITDDSKDE